MVEKEINKHTYTNKWTKHIENKQQSTNIAGIHLNGKIYIKLSLISNVARVGLVGKTAVDGDSVGRERNKQTYIYKQMNKTHRK